MLNESPQERLRRIVDRLRAGRVSVRDLSRELGVSEITIRRDLVALKAQGKLLRVSHHDLATVPDEVLGYLARVRALARVPVCAGFGIRSREQVERLNGHVDGVVVGSALVEVLERGGLRIGQ